jgi:hypothetical protein
VIQFQLFYSDLVDFSDEDTDLNPDTLLFHLYQHPDHARGSLYCRSRLRMYNQILQKMDAQNPEGQGLKFVLTFSPFWPLLYGVLIVVAGIGFGVIWYAVTKQLETGFTVAGTVVATLGLLALIISLLSSRDVA